MYVTATACTALAYVVFPGDPCADLVLLEGSCDAITLGRGSGYWRTLGAVLAGTLPAFLRRSGP